MKSFKNVMVKYSSVFKVFRSLFIGLLIGGIILLLSGYNPIEAYGQMLLGVISKPQYISWTVIKATPIILTGLSVAFAFRTGLFNIGAEGQFIVGTLVATILGVSLKIPSFIHVPVVIVGAIFAGGIYGAFAGYLKAKFKVNEVISTIMLNWIALYVANYFVYLPSIKKVGSESTYDISETAKITTTLLNELTGRGVKNNWGVIIAIIVVIIAAFYLFRTTKGYELRAVGLNKHGAKYAGININKATIRSMFIAGALAGLAGAVHVMGVTYHISKLSISENYGFNGIAVSLLAANSPIGVIFAGLFFAGMQYGNAKMQFIGIPSEVINIIFGLIIFNTALSSKKNNLFSKFYLKLTKGGTI
ncbi:MAG: ABC transporter permease [Vallitalea sp.]|jgi:simple sugar transport system permease protein|nr:ABC transporter permease [Vallitalea sp.]